MDRSATVEKLRSIAMGLREDVVSMLAEAGSGHPGGSLSAVDLVNALFNHEMRHRPTEPGWPARDRFLLSKGQAAPALYATLAQQGYFQREKLMTLRKLGSPLQGHPVNTLLPGVEAPSGSFGQGLSIALGFAMASKIDHPAHGGPRSYAILGDGELQAGQIWEAALCAPSYQLDNLCVLLDHHRPPIDGHGKDGVPVEEKWRAFNWHVRTINGHDYSEILDALDEARATRGKPTFIVAHTLQGKGVSFFEADPVTWHGVAPSREEAARAVEEIRRGIDGGSW